MLSVTISNFLSATAPFLLQGVYEEQLKLALSLGYRAVELHIRDPKIPEIESLGKTIDKLDIRISAIGTGQAYGVDKLYFTSPDPEIRNKAVRRIKDQIEFASRFNSVVIIGLIRGPLPQGKEEAEAARLRAIECIKECAHYAEKYGTYLAVEAINRYETNFLNTAEEVVKLIKEVGSPFLGLHLDTFHMNLEEVSIEKTIKDFASHLVYVHLADSNRRIPGKGHLDFAKILGAINETGYSGFLGLECIPWPDQLSAAKEALQYVGSLYANVSDKVYQ